MYIVHAFDLMSTIRSNDPHNRMSLEQSIFRQENLQEDDKIPPSFFGKLIEYVLVNVFKIHLFYYVFCSTSVSPYRALSLIPVIWNKLLNPFKMGELITSKPTCYPLHAERWCALGRLFFWIVNSQAEENDLWRHSLLKTVHFFPKTINS